MPAHRVQEADKSSYFLLTVVFSLLIPPRSDELAVTGTVLSFSSPAGPGEQCNPPPPLSSFFNPSITVLCTYDCERESVSVCEQQSCVFISAQHLEVCVSVLILDSVCKDSNELHLSMCCFLFFISFYFLALQWYCMCLSVKLVSIKKNNSYNQTQCVLHGLHHLFTHSVSFQANVFTSRLVLLTLVPTFSQLSTSHFSFISKHRVKKVYPWPGVIIIYYVYFPLLFPLSHFLLHYYNEISI